MERRLSVTPRTNKDILHDIQELLHNHNPYVRSFKTVSDSMPLNS